MTWIRAHAVPIFAGANVLVVIHLLDDAFVDGPRGISVWSNLATDAVPMAVALAAVIAFPFLSPALQAWVAFLFGALLVIDGGLHVSHVAKNGSLGGSDLTGLLAGAAGVVLLVLAIALVLRPKSERRPLPRWAARLAVVAAVAATGYFLLLPLGGAMYIVHKQPSHVRDAQLPIGHENVTFHSTDGLELAGWFVPSRDGAVVIVLHGSGGDRSGGPRSRILMLARHGFGVLAYDARGSGDSEGRPENLGWTWHRDIEGAVEYLRARGITRIGGLGLSSGAEAMVETAGNDPRIKAVVAEGTQGRTVRDTLDLPNGLTKVQLLSNFPLMYTATQAMSRAPEPPSLKTQVAKIGPRPLLLISSGTGYERDANRVFYRAAGDPKELWEMPNAPHTGGLATYPQRYERRVVAFFERALAPPN
jgi:uncharacterized protein